MTQNTAFIILASVILALLVGFVLAKWSASHKTPAAIKQAETVVAEDGWKLLAKTVAVVADSTAKKQAVANATADLAEHFQNVAKLKATVAALPDA